MATVIKTDGTSKSIAPTKGKFTLKELQALVGGYIEIVIPKYIPNGTGITSNKEGVAMVMDEEGKLKHLPYNRQATLLYGAVKDIVVGDVILVNHSEFDY